MLLTSNVLSLNVSEMRRVKDELKIVMFYNSRLFKFGFEERLKAV